MASSITRSAHGFVLKRYFPLPFGQPLDDLKLRQRNGWYLSHVLFIVVFVFVVSAAVATAVYGPCIAFGDKV